MSGNKKRNNLRLVVKFGGSSLADGLKISRAVNAVIEEKNKGTEIAVVVSAMGKTTDHLIKTSKHACNNRIKPNELDDIIAMGERTSARIFAAALRAKGQESHYLDPSSPDWPIITDDSFNSAKPILPVCEERIRSHIQPLLQKGIVVVLPGFIGRTENGVITTMGRGGSDITAMILAHSLSAKQVILVTDVNGIMTADPKIIKKPQRLKEIPMDVLVGLADSGTKFIHKKALRFKSPSINLKVINNVYGNLRSEGTIIRGSFPNNIIVDAHPGLSMAVTIVGKAISESPQTLQEILQQINKFDTPLLGMSINHNSLILYLPMDSSKDLLETLHSIVVNDEKTLALAVRKNLAFISIKGVGLEETPGVISAISKALYSSSINIYGIFTITSSVLVFVDSKEKEKAIQLIRKEIKSHTG